MLLASSRVLLNNNTSSYTQVAFQLASLNCEVPLVGLSSCLLTGLAFLQGPCPPKDQSSFVSYVYLEFLVLSMGGFSLSEVLTTLLRIGFEILHWELNGETIFTSG